MTDTRQYSTFLQCLYDQPEAIGSLGRGAHYSIFRCVERVDVAFKPTNPPHIHDFAVIWDEDHDSRVIRAIEALYMADLLAGVQFVGERKGTLTLILAAHSYTYGISPAAYKARAQKVVDGALIDDYWAVELGTFDRSEGSPHQRHPAGIISDSDFKVNCYLLSIDAMWRLGTKPWTPYVESKVASYTPPPPPVPGSPPFKMPPVPGR